MQQELKKSWAKITMLNFSHILFSNPPYRVLANNVLCYLHPSL